MQPEQEQEIARLRALNLSPKQIARNLGLKQSEVKAAIQALAREKAGDEGGLAPIADCWLDADTAAALFGIGSATAEGEEEEEGGGLATVIVVRSPGYNRYIVANYLVDYWCLGIKNAMPPETMNKQKYGQFRSYAYSSYGSPPERITLQQAQALIFSAERYASELGFNPHADFDKARSHLGEWDGSNPVECGKDGQPYYFGGPYDDAHSILKTLEESVGEGNFHYVVPIEDEYDDFFV